VSFDRLEIGKMQAQYLVEHAPKGNYVLIAGSPNDEGAKALHGAQMSVLQPYIARGDIKVLADAYTKDWLPSEAYLFTLKAIESSPAKSLLCSLPMTDSPAARFQASANMTRRQSASFTGKMRI